MSPEPNPEQNPDTLRISLIPPQEGGTTLSPPDSMEPGDLSAPPQIGVPTNPSIPADSPLPQSQRRKKRQKETPQSYYDVPMLQAPVWKWEIATYFFLGGLSAGAYVLARMASRFGGKRYKDVEQAGALIAAAAFVPCAPLLVRDLGDWKRFHYMLRVFRPKSPMSVGSWTLTGYGAFVTLAALNEWRKARRDRSWLEKIAHKATARVERGPGITRRIADGLESKSLDPVVDAALDGGVPFALMLAGYTGVLLSTSANPLWARKKWLGALFSVSAVSTGISAIELALQVKSPHAEAQPSHAPLRKLEAVAKIAEAVTLAGYLNEAGKLAEPITKGKYAPHLWGGAVGAGLVGSALLGALPVKNPKTRRVLRIAGAVAGLAGGLALRHFARRACLRQRSPDCPRLVALGNSQKRSGLPSRY